MEEELYGNPWIFRNIINVLGNNEKIYAPSLEERLEVIKKHIELVVKQKGENIGIKEMRKHLAYYTKNLKDSSALRQKINTIDNKKELLECLENYFNC